MLEGLGIGFVIGIAIPIVIGLIAARFIMAHPDIFGKIFVRKMMSATKKVPKQELQK